MSLPGIIQKATRVLMRLIARVLFSAKAHGLENIGDIKSPFIVAANHVGRIDPFLAGFYFSRKSFYKSAAFRFPAYKGYMDIPLLGLFMKVYGAYIILQGSKKPLEEVMAQSVQILKNGQNIMIFPQGQMVFSESEKIPARPGVAYLARETGVPIIPVFIKRKRRKMFFPKYALCYGKPFYYSDIAGENDDLREDAGRVMERVFLCHCEERVELRRLAERNERRSNLVIRK